jgi:hypothetical protein
MDEKLIKTILDSKNVWVAVIVLTLYMGFQLFTQYLNNKKTKSKTQALEVAFDEIKMNIAIIKNDFKHAKANVRLIESVNRRLTIIANKYNSELSSEAAIVILQNIYFNFASELIAEINDLRNTKISIKSLIDIIRNRISILNDEKIHDLGLFLFRNKQLITYTNGEILSDVLVLEIIQNYASKNGMLAKEILNKTEIELSKVIKRLY